MRDYLYIPLGGNRYGEGRRSLNIMITMLLGGLWHGAGWNFIIWGGLHGLYLSINHQWRSFRKSLGHDLKKTHWWSQTLARFITFIAVVVSWVLFRAENLNAALLIFKGMVGLNGIAIPIGIANKLGGIKPILATLGVTFPKWGGANMTLTYLWSFTLLAIAWLTPNIAQWMQNYNPTLENSVAPLYHGWNARLWRKLQWQPTRVFSLIFSLLIFILVKTLFDAPKTEFLYFNF